MLNKINIFSVLVFIMLLGYVNPNYFHFEYQFLDLIIFDFITIKYLLNLLTLVLFFFILINFSIKSDLTKIFQQSDRLDIIILISICYFISVNFFFDKFEFENLKKNIQILVCGLAFFITRNKNLNFDFLNQFFKILIILTFTFLFVIKILNNEILVFQNSSNALAMLFFICISFLILFENHNRNIYFYIFLSLCIFYLLSSKIFFIFTILFFLFKNYKLNKSFFIFAILFILLNNFVLPKFLLQKYPNLRDINNFNSTTKICSMFSTSNYGFKGFSAVGEFFFDYENFNAMNLTNKSLTNWVHYCLKYDKIYLSNNIYLITFIDNLYTSLFTRYNLFEIATSESLKSNFLPIKEKFSVKKNLINNKIGNSFHSSYNFLLYKYGIIGLVMIFFIFYYVYYSVIKFKIKDKKKEKLKKIFLVCIIFLSLENYIFFNNIICSLFFWSLIGACANKKINYD
jgi:hypothetical protein